MRSRTWVGHGLRCDLDLLEALASPEAQRTGGLGVAAIARLAGREKSQVSRALQALAEEGVVERDPDTREWRLFSLVARTAEDGLVRAAEPVLRRPIWRRPATCACCAMRRSSRSVSAHSFRVHGWEGRSIRPPGVCCCSTPRPTSSTTAWSAFPRPYGIFAAGWWHQPATRLGDRLQTAGQVTAPAAPAAPAELGWR
ncbi:helix-turn-helix domain-containing protein [Amycolatopsis sp. GM8]|uniref:helix-turn-helix domain-containing protein n=1 Tax=Amycolatopsis sp. GM8 TaxID=2896530 RepID=UPI0027DF7337|nr:helix-turn-helix domain-containing protein [Amycolatopsis sp. GM8]